jgi:hypothetical protein
VICGCHESQCSEIKSTIRVDIEFDNFPQDISWSVKNTFGQELWHINFENYVRNGSLNPASFRGCVPRNETLHFTIRDKHQDGLCCGTDASHFEPSGNRGYEVYLDEELVGMRKFPMGSRQDLIFMNGDKSSQPRINQTVVWCESCNRQCNICPNDNDFNPNEIIFFELYGIESCQRFFSNTSNVITPEFCSEIQDHVSASCGCKNFQPKCSSTESLIVFQTEIESTDGSVTFQIRNEQNITLRTKSGFAGEIGEIRDYKACIPSFEKIYVGVYDYCSEAQLCEETKRWKNFKIYLNKNVIADHRFTKPENEFVLYPN